MNISRQAQGNEAYSVVDVDLASLPTAEMLLDGQTPTLLISSLDCGCFTEAKPSACVIFLSQ